MRIKKLTGLVFLAAVLSFFFSTALADAIDVIPGGDNIHQAYSGNFKAGDFNLVNTDIDENGYLKLITGYDAIDPNHIVIPFTQDVSVTFLYEGTDYNLIDFGWMPAEGGINGPKHEIYRNINDNDRNGVLDRGPNDQNHAYGDTNGDGTVDARDNKMDLGRFAGGTELVFYLKVDDTDRIFYTKQNWKADDYKSISGECGPELAGNKFTKAYHLGRPLANEGACSLDGNWLTSEAYGRAKDLLGLQFDDDATASLEIEHHKPFSHVIIGAPGNNPQEWIMGWEDSGDGGDTDHNDLIFQIERPSGGTAQLPPEKTLVPGPDNDFFTGVTVAVYDQMPCAGKTAITYELLHGGLGDDSKDGKVDKDLIALEITDWDEVHSFTLSEDGTIKPGRRITGWKPGNPEFTYRTRRLDLAGLGLAPGKLSWKAIFNSREDACVPRMIGLSLDAGVAAQGRDDKAMRGHLVATRLYDPRNPDDTATATIWDAGEVLNQKSPKDRIILFPDMEVTPISNEKLGDGNGSKRTFSGTLRNRPLLATSISITDQTERFYDKHTDVLAGNLGGAGTINRFTGQYEITFNTAPGKDQPITASYNYYTARQQLLDFKTGNVTHAMLGIDDTKIFPGGFSFDFNEDGDYTLDDGSWLINWVRGYKDGKSKPKQWLLGAIDHSVPAAATPPGKPAWLFGTAIPAAELKSYESYQITNALRSTVMYVGARDGMLHAFDAGKFRHGYNERTAFKENRGYFEWQDKSGDCPD
jgi:hypothetical protein